MQTTFIRRTVILLLPFLFVNHLPAQRWMDQMYRGVDFKTIQEDFYKEWEGKAYRKGSGYKQFKRWEHFMEPRTYPSGKGIPTRQLWDEFLKLQQQEARLSCPLNWTPAGPLNWINGNGWNPGNGRVNTVEEDPNNPAVLYVGVPSGGCWKSVNGGSSWTCLTDDLPVLGVSGIAVDPGNSDIVYIGTGDGDGSDTYSIGVLKSVDGGTSWNTTGLSWTIDEGLVIRRLIIDPNNSNMLFCASNNGIYKTTDGGANWINELGGSMQDVEFHPTNSNIIYACNDQFYKSTDGGNNFNPVTSGLPVASDVNRFKIAVSPDQPDYVYAVAGKSSDGTFLGLYRSTNSGNSFTTQVTSPNMFGYESDGGDTSGQSSYDMALAVNPANADDLVIGGINVWRSVNGGLSFNIISQWIYGNTVGYVHADIHDLAYFGNNLYCCSDGSISKSTDNGNNWTNLSNGIANMQFYAIDMSQTAINSILGGAQDNGTNLHTGNGTWRHVLGADGMECLINPTDNNIMYGTIQYGTLYKSVNGFNSASQILETGDRNEGSGWVAPLTIDPNNHNTIYIGYENVHKSVDAGSTWTTISNFASTSAVDALKVAPSNSNYIYVIKYSSVYRTTDGGSNWSNITQGLPNLIPTDIAIDPYNPQRIWLSFSGYDAGEKVYASGNGGNSWNNYSSGLPNIPANTIAFLPESNDGLYLGMDFGIYYIDNNMTAWETCLNGLPKVIVTDIEIGCNYGKIRAATFGRGVWEADINACTAVAGSNLSCLTLGALTIDETLVDITGLEVKNVGSLDAGTFEVGYYLSADQEFTTADYLLGTNTIAALAYGATTPLDFNVNVNTVLSDLPLGSYYVGYIIDHLDAVSELVEIDNNDCSWSEPRVTLCSGGNTVSLNLLLDDYPEETSWEIRNETGAVVALGGGYDGMAAQLVVEDACLVGSCFDFIIYDIYSDGICCGYGIGNYSLTAENGTLLASGAEFGSQDSTNFCLCVPDQQISGPVAAGTYSTGNSISSDGKVSSPDDVVFNAGNNITLTPLFEVESGADFLARIQGCGIVTADATPEFRTGMRAVYEREFFRLKAFTTTRATTVIPHNKPGKDQLIAEVHLPSPGRLQIWVQDEHHRTVKHIRIKGKQQPGVYLFQLDKADLGIDRGYLKVRSGRGKCKKWF